MGKIIIEDYIKDRVDPQIEWYSHKSSLNKIYTLLSRTSIVILSASIPFLVEMMHYNQELTRDLIFVFALLIGIITSISAFSRVQEKWYSYRTTAETLKHQKMLYLMGSGPYKNSISRDTEFVERIEHAISKENSDWGVAPFEEG